MALLKENYPEDLRFVYRHFPLSIHDKAMLSAQVAEAAALQGQFWEMHDLIFDMQQEWAAMGIDEFRGWVVEQADNLGLDIDQFSQDIDSEVVVARVQRDLDESTTLGLPGTPSLAINGRYYTGPLDYASLSAIIKLIKLEDRQFTECPPTVIDLTQQYRATIKTEKGDLVFDMFPEQAPIAVNNFVFLAQNDWFDGITFHRVIPDTAPFMAQGGDPTGTGFGGPGYAFQNEIDPDLNFDKPGVVAMANAGPDSNGSQFFITYAPVEQLNGGYTIFGQLVEGFDVLESLTPRDPSVDPGLPPGDLILDVEIEER